MGRLRNVNTTDIPDAIRLGCRTMSMVFNADDNHIPFFCSQVRPEAMLGFSPYASESHVPGRHLNALLNAGDAIGIRIDDETIERHARALFFSYSGPVPLPLNRSEIGGPLVNFLSHNIREGFHGLFALVKFRNSSRARNLAEASIHAIFKYWNPEHGWDREHLERKYGLTVFEEQNFITGLGRAIGPLVKYYRATGYAPALELASVLKEKAVNEFFTEEGNYDVEIFGTHCHSTTCVMSSLAQLADLTSDTHLLNRVKTFYDRGLLEIRDALGWVTDYSGSDASCPDAGESNNTGDIVETALILGKRGYAEYYHDAERTLRCHLLPSQLRDVSFIKDPPNPGDEDGKRDVANRHVGAWGFPAPYGHETPETRQMGFNMDIVGGVVGSLCEAYRETVRFDKAVHRVNMLFDYENETIKVESPYTHPALRIRTKRPGALYVRIPPWVETDNIVISGITGVPQYTGGYLFIANPPVNQAISLEFNLPLHEIILNHRTRQIRTRFRGDQVVAMENFGTNLTFFEPL